MILEPLLLLTCPLLDLRRIAVMTTVTGGIYFLFPLRCLFCPKKRKAEAENGMWKQTHTDRRKDEETSRREWLETRTTNTCTDGMIDTEACR